MSLNTVKCKTGREIRITSRFLGNRTPDTARDRSMSIPELYVELGSLPRPRSRLLQLLLALTTRPDPAWLWWQGTAWTKRNQNWQRSSTTTTMNLRFQCDGYQSNMNHGTLTNSHFCLLAKATRRTETLDICPGYLTEV